MPADIMLTVIATSIVQSVFGAGVLLFGTPILLLLGHLFVDALVVLLPISVAINLLTDEMLYVQIDQSKYRRIFSVFLAVAGALLMARALNSP
jgi:hypothetical protein